MRFLLPVDARSTRRHETHDGRDGPIIHHDDYLLSFHHHSTHLDPNLELPYNDGRIHQQLNAIKQWVII